MKKCHHIKALENGRFLKRPFFYFHNITLKMHLVRESKKIIMSELNFLPQDSQ